MRKRTQARELAIQVLYQLDLRGPEVLEDGHEMVAERTANSEVASFARELVAGTWERRSEVDELIERFAKNWKIYRMAVVDRNILRLAVYEIVYRHDVPPLVAINEAINLAKKYSTNQSGPFVNGILDGIRQSLSLEAPPVPHGADRDVTLSESGGKEI